MTAELAHGELVNAYEALADAIRIGEGLQAKVTRYEAALAQIAESQSVPTVRRIARDALREPA